jgi:hypothetical protein
VHHKIAADQKVLNDCGTKDIWPVLARAVTWGFGPTGTFGFGDPRVHDRYHEKTHGEYFDGKFVRTYWAPYIAEGKIISTDWEKTRPTPPFWMSLLAALAPIRWLLVALLSGAGYFLMRTHGGF